MKTLLHQFKKGSILAYTLIVLSIMLMTVLSAATVTLIQKRNAQNTTDSTQAFYVAESASEVVLNKISKSPDSTLSDLGTCQDGIVTINDVPTGSAKVVFYSDEQGTKLNCFQKISQAREIKAIGYYADNSRAIKVAVAGGGDCEFVEVGKDCKNQYGDIVYCAEEIFTANKLCYDKKGHNYYAVATSNFFSSKRCIFGAPGGLTENQYPIGRFVEDRWTAAFRCVQYV